MAYLPPGAGTIPEATVNADYADDTNIWRVVDPDGKMPYVSFCIDKAEDYFINKKARPKVVGVKAVRFGHPKGTDTVFLNRRFHRCPRPQEASSKPGPMAAEGGTVWFAEIVEMKANDYCH